MYAESNITCEMKPCLAIEISYFAKLKTFPTLSQFAETVTEIISTLEFIFSYFNFYIDTVSVLIKIILKTSVSLLPLCVMRISDDLHTCYMKSGYCVRRICMDDQHFCNNVVQGEHPAGTIRMSCASKHGVATLSSK